LLVAALYVLATRGTAARKDAIPFGPFLALGGILAFFLG
jgi:prepilin signal peptidase PulO-like enzyme (type II secretory pathway)